MSTIANLKQIDALQESKSGIQTRPYQVFTERRFDAIEPVKQLPEVQRFEMRVVANVLPFRVNQYVIDELIDWDAVPEDPIFQLVFPQKAMLAPEDFERMAKVIRAGADGNTLRSVAQDIRKKLNPHPSGQQTLNVPLLEGKPLEGMQHKYRETLLFFPSQGQVCHSYCSFCFRWAQFVGDKELRFASNEVDSLQAYLQAHPEVTDLLITGGDPMVMKTRHLANYLEFLLQPEFEHVQSIRIGTKSLTFWPYRYVTDPDAGELLVWLEKLVKQGKHVAIMAHFNHWQEMETPVVQEAIRLIRQTGAIIRTQAPLLKHINNAPEIWSKMWRQQVKLGLVPYYMFVERDTGARRYFEVPLARAFDVYQKAVKSVSGLGRTVRGPSMSAAPGKVEILGTSEINGEKVFVLRFVQGRNPDWTHHPFFARYDSQATWLNQLQPAWGEESFFFEEEFNAMCQKAEAIKEH